MRLLPLHTLGDEPAPRPHTMRQLDEKWGVQSRPVGIAGSLRVSLRYNFFPFLTRKELLGMAERVFQHPAEERTPPDVLR